MDNKIDLTKYPEGFQEVIKSMNFLPDDEKARIGFLVLVWNLLKWA